MTVDIEKLKALALAARDERVWPFHELAFHKAANPAAVLELIAEVERYRWLTEKLGYIRPNLNGQAVYVNWSGTKQAFEAAIDAAIEKEKA